ncbi:hypothetical protein FCM35_KLT17841 [Carex littledalei]|uniref:Uncharacterized protein n=1 Tax=Carex littledalei TaxID=544730 RepID=A0A833R908_9POAL|nr:hypothetical protein FCM35_KLT17841 [Carex littledalei]
MEGRMRRTLDSGLEDAEAQAPLSGSNGLAVSAVIKYGDNIVKVYSTSVAIFLTAFVSVHMFGFTLTPTFYIGTMIVSIAIYLHYVGKPQQPQK